MSAEDDLAHEVERLARERRQLETSRERVESWQRLTPNPRTQDADTPAPHGSSLWKGVQAHEKGSSSPTTAQDPGTETTAQDPEIPRVFPAQKSFDWGALKQQKPLSKAERKERKKQKKAKAAEKAREREAKHEAKKLEKLQAKIAAKKKAKADDGRAEERGVRLADKKEKKQAEQRHKWNKKASPQLLTEHPTPD